MTIWRVVVVVVIGLCSLSLVISAAFFDQAWWINPFEEAPFPRSPHQTWRDSFQTSGGLRTNIAVILASLVSQFLAGVLLMYIAPLRLRRMANELNRGGTSALKSLAIGILFSVLLVAVALLSIFTLHIFPLPVILFGIAFLSGLVGMTVLAYCLGFFFLQKADWMGQSPLASLALGTLVFFTLIWIPIVGFAAMVLIWITGIGVVIETRFGSEQTWSLKPFTEEMDA
jgi:hypothetical protein